MTIMYAACIVAGLSAAAWGLVASHRLRSPWDTAAAVAVPVGLVIACWVSSCSSFRVFSRVKLALLFTSGVHCSTTAEYIRSIMEKLKSIAVNALVITVIAIVLVWITTWQRQRTQYNRGEAALVAGDYINAIAGYESAIHCIPLAVQLWSDPRQSCGSWAKGWSDRVTFPAPLLRTAP